MHRSDNQSGRSLCGERVSEPSESQGNASPPGGENHEPEAPGAPPANDVDQTAVGEDDSRPDNSSLTEVEVQASRVAAALRSLVPDVVAEPARQYVRVVVPANMLEPAAIMLRDDLGYALLSMVTAVDFPDRIEVIYLAFTLEHPHAVELRTQLPRDELPDCPSLTTVWPGADFQEREVYDMMGVNFVGHPDLRRILTDDDFPGHPLRKDFTIEPDYVLMRHLRYGVEGQFRPEGDENSGKGEPGDSDGANARGPAA
jgi:NADH-quinone oxidoreductase subunit C